MNNSSATGANDNSSCNLQVNPWCDQFGIQQYFDNRIFKYNSSPGCVLETGLVIFSIVLAGKISKQGNVFIINLVHCRFFSKYCIYKVL